MQQPEASISAGHFRVRGQRLLAKVFAALFLIAGQAAIAAETLNAGSSAALFAGELTKKGKSIRGGWRIEQRESGAVLVLGDDFKTRSGPDLKVFLSPTAFSSLRGSNALDGSVVLGELKSTRGTQEYAIPAGVNLSAFNSVIVHCEAYSVLWGGSQLKAVSGAGDL